MTPDKIEEGFTEWAKFLEDDHAGYIYSEQAWQACAEWMLSQGEIDFDEFYKKAMDSDSIAGWMISSKLLEDKTFCAFLWKQARLSSAKELKQEIAEKDAKIKALEIENFELFSKLKLLHTLNDGGKIKIRSFDFDADKFPLAKELASKKEST
jgi:hypothetical protein